MRFVALAFALALAVVLPGCTSGNGSFALHVTDKPDAIGDFSSLNVTVSKITLTNKDGGTKDYDPATKTFDLTKLVSGNVSTIFSGAVDNGNYTKLTLHVSDATGTLASGNGTASVKAPSGQLFLPTSFEIASGKTTDFLFDITVHQEGNGDYSFQPNAGTSGAGKKAP